MYVAVVAAVIAVFARVSEEPALHHQFGAQYEAYRQHVPGWLPRTRPWQPGDPG
jgi:protein-S-isoprenylcysteine O-methyltransferase Ste14